MNRRAIVPFISILFYVALYGIIALLKPPSLDSIHQLQTALKEPLEIVIENRSFQEQSLDQNHSSNFRTLNTEAVTISVEDCLKNKKKKEDLRCKILSGLSKHFQLLNCSKCPFKSESAWNNVFFLYAITAHSINRILPENVTVSQGSFQLGTSLQEIKNKISRSDLSHYLRYLKNAPSIDELSNSLSLFSDILTNTSNQTCKIKIKDRIETCFSIFQSLFELSAEIKSQKAIKMMIFWQQLSHSLTLFYENNNKESFPLEHMNSWLNHVEFYYFLVGAGIVFIYLLCQVDIKHKVSKQFRHTFPPGNRFKIE